MACYDTSPYICTYHSDGDGNLPGGGNPDYSSLATWESASDNDITGYSARVELACYYKDGGHTDAIVLSSATTDATHYRVVRSAKSTDSPAETTPFAGKDSTGALFINSTDIAQGGPMSLSESYARVEQISVHYTPDSSSSRYAIYLYSANTKAAHCIAKCTNAGSGLGHGIYATQADNLIYACIAKDCKSYGIQIASAGAETQGAICCTAIGNGAYGFYGGTANSIVFSCYGGNNTTEDFVDDTAWWVDPSDYNVSGDESSDLGGESTNYTHNKDYWDGGGDDAMDSDHLLTASVDEGRNPYNDVTATSDFDDFLRNDTAGDALFKYSIEGNERPNEDTADATWDVGASEYVAAGGATSILPMINYYNRLLRN